MSLTSIHADVRRESGGTITIILSATMIAAEQG